MESVSLGAGLAAFAFWGFVAVCVVAGIWDANRKREARHETLRRLIESGQTLDETALATLSGDGDLARDLRMSGLIMLGLAPGLVLLGWGISTLSPEVWPVMLGVAALVLCIAIGLLVAARAVR